MGSYQSQFCQGSFGRDPLGRLCGAVRSPASARARTVKVSGEPPVISVGSAHAGQFAAWAFGRFQLKPRLIARFKCLTDQTLRQRERAGSNPSGYRPLPQSEAAACLISSCLSPSEINPSWTKVALVANKQFRYSP